MTVNYALHTKKYGEKLYSNLVIMNMKKAINYDFVLNEAQTTIEISNIENVNIFPKSMMEVIYSFMINEILLDFKKKYKMNDNDFIRLSSLVYEDRDIHGNQYFLLVELSEWFNNNSHYNLDNLIDFKLRKYKNFLQGVVTEIFEEEKENQELMEKVKELEDYTTKVFSEKFGIEKFRKLTVHMSEDGQSMYYETGDGLKLDLEFIQETLGLLIRFNDESEPVHEKTEMINSVKVLQLLIATLEVDTLDITEIEQQPFELTLVCNLFYSMCASLNRKPTLINRNFLSNDDSEDDGDNEE